MDFLIWLTKKKVWGSDDFVLGGERDFNLKYRNKLINKLDVGRRIANRLFNYSSSQEGPKEGRQEDCPKEGRPKEGHQEDCPKGQVRQEVQEVSFVLV